MVKKIIAGVLAVLVVGFAVFKIFFDKPGLEDKASNFSKNLTSYYLEANMDIRNGEDKREFFVCVTYLKDDGEDLFKVSLLDKGLNQEQLIIKNGEGVFVLTPALNKVYQFKGDWPMSSPKPYIYQSLLDTFKLEHSKTESDNGTIITSFPKFDNKGQWHKQEVKFDSSLKPIYVNIYDDNNNNVVNVEFLKVELSVNVNEDTFDVDNNLAKARETVSAIVVDENALPYIPVNTNVTATLKEQSFALVNGELIYVLSYEGAKSFTIVQKVVADNETVMTSPVSGQLVDLMNGIGIYQNGILQYVYNGIEYNIYSNDLTLAEMMDLANGMELNVEK